ncbi:phytoene desaturase family protein [Levilactobacillus lanxiensis]|uniref:Phytoene desaturase family protein n=1 Tax=Levilactobacillus lanxiensis TaxID=2799568 RepID=A0ABW4D0N6_9LACO|nr:NAD(P)/FAD-dependent oxidoreductase [Levilactobacillus lanxiensis]
MSKQYDVIVIGAGNGGLVAAATAAKLGQKVLLLERHNLPGGAATSFVRGRFEFEPSLHELASYGPETRPGGVRQLFDWLNLDVKLDPVPDAYRLINTGKDRFDVRMPTGIPAFIKALNTAAPGNEDAINKFFALATESTTVFQELFSDPTKSTPETLAKTHPQFIQYGHKPYQKVLDELGLSTKAQEILMAYWCYIGIPGDEFEFAYFAAMVVSYVALSAYVPRHRSHEISSALIKSLQDNGGDAWFNTEATQLIVQNKAVVGVKTAHQTLYAKQVIADLHPNTVYSHLLKPNEVPQRELKKANARKLGTSGFLIYLGLNKSAEELGITDYSTFIAQSWDSRHQYQGMQQLTNNDFMIMNCLNIAEPACSPKGTSILYATQLFDDPSWNDVTPADYPRLKNQLTEHVIAKYEAATGIKIRDAIEEIEVATPATFARYLRGPQGEIYGYYGQPWDQMMARALSLKDEDEPLPHLHFCGGTGFLMDGYSSAYQSGYLAAKMTTNKLNQEANEQ